ncbi:MAG: peptide deformylase [Acidimicrobiales bacterium]
MSLLPIRVYGDPVLNTVTTDVENIDATIAALAESMIETMYDAPGVGLAANQVGVQKRLFVYDEGEGDGAFVVINPTIVETDGEWTFHEGCLSVPGLSWDITRFKDVHLTGFDLDGNELDIHATDYQARIFQHETDHLDGHLLIERLDADQRRDAKIYLRENRERLGVSDHDGLHRLFGE